MKHNSFILAATVILSALVACAPKTTIEWTQGPIDENTGLSEYTIVINNPPKGDDWSVWFSQLRVRPQIQEGSTVTLEHIAGSLHRLYPVADCTEKAEVRYLASGIERDSWAPEMFTLDVKGKKPVQVEATYTFPEGPAAVEFVYTPVEVNPENMVPALKSIEYLEGTTLINKDEITSGVINLAGKEPGWYRITIDGAVKVEAVDEDGIWYAGITIDNLLRNAQGKEVRNMVIEDWPDFQYRGAMLDVARNFTTKDNVLRLIDILAHYKVNYLHLHLGEDESFRLEIEDLPELTTYAAVHALPQISEDGKIIEKDALMPSYSGAFYPEQENSANGYYSKADYIEILKYATAHHMYVITEMDTPGHARAAIKAMEKYAERTGDTSYLLSEPGDTSKYRSVQHYDDNAINVALESTYKFMGKFFDTVIEYYKEAGAPLVAIHVGGDEVATGAWFGSPACQRLMEEKSLSTKSDLMHYYFNRVLDLAQERGVKIAGWQEIAHNLDDATLARMQKDLAFTNCWSTHRSSRTDELPYIYANQGLNVILSNMTNTYADFSYYPVRSEKGLDWGGIVDERRSFSFNPYDVYKSVRWDDNGQIVDIKDLSVDKTALTPEAVPHILGVQTQLWTETIRTFDDVTYYFFPKMAGIFERAWNARPVWAETTVSDDPLFVDDFNRFYSVVETYEYPYYESLGIKYRKHNQ